MDETYGSKGGPMAKATAKWIDGLRFIAWGDSGHAIVLDSSSDKSFDTGPRPMEVLLMSLIGCTGMDVIYILHKMRVYPDAFEVTVEAERAPQHPKVYSRVHVTYRVKGKNIPREKVEEAVRLSQGKYCAVSATMKAVGELTYDVVVTEE